MAEGSTSEVRLGHPIKKCIILFHTKQYKCYIHLKAKLTIISFDLINSSQIPSAPVRKIDEHLVTSVGLRSFVPLFRTTIAKYWDFANDFCSGAMNFCLKLIRAFFELLFNVPTITYVRLDFDLLPN